MTTQAIGALRAAYDREMREVREENVELQEKVARLEKELEDNKKMVDEKARAAKEIIEERERQLDKAERREEKMKESKKKYVRRYHEANTTILGLKSEIRKFYLFLSQFICFRKIEKEARYGVGEGRKKHRL